MDLGKIGDQNSFLATSESQSRTATVNFGFVKYNPSSGPLEAIGIRFVGAAGAIASGTHFENLSNTSSAGLNANERVFFTLTDAAGGSMTRSVFLNESVTLNNTSAAGTQFSTTLPAQSTDSELYVLPTSAFASYQGTGNVNMPLTLQFNISSMRLAFNYSRDFARFLRMA